VKSEKGFTLLEIIVVIVIIGILATLGITQYIPSRERAIGREAIANLKLIAAAERIYRMEYGTFYPPDSGTTEGSVNNINTNLKLSLTVTNWAYSITGGTDTFTASAARNGAGGYQDCEYSLATGDADGEPESNGSCP
jgi:prepilin-type N-terminal cleavage/methylation domain-containing protein